jgi:hypothetical protein
MSVWVHWKGKPLALSSLLQFYSRSTFKPLTRERKDCVSFEEAWTRVYEDFRPTPTPQAPAFDHSFEKVRICTTRD